MTCTFKKKKPGLLSMELKLRPGPSYAGQIVYEGEGITMELEKEALTLLATCFHPGQNHEIGGYGILDKAGAISLKC